MKESGDSDVLNILKVNQIAPLLYDLIHCDNKKQRRVYMKMSIKTVGKPLTGLIALFSLLICFNGTGIGTHSFSNSVASASGTNLSSVPVTKASINSMIIKPPTDFKPLQATAEELKKYGFPQKPTDPVKLKEWQKAMEHAINYVEPQQTALPANYPTNGLVRTLNHQNWAGYSIESRDNSNITFNEAFSAFTVPQYNGSYCPSYWTGMGGAYGSSIIQAGVWTNADHNGGNGAHSEFWVEDYPSGTILEGSPYVASSNEVYIDVQDKGSTSTAFLENISHNTYTTVTFNSPNHDKTSADYISEACGGNEDSFGDMEFLSAYFGSSSGEGSLQNYNYTRFNMDNTTLSDVNSDGTSAYFYVYS